ncbi:MAG: AraC family transcriptional regulator [bacterium]|nr:AraC family transcriptional regulator [bacterium]
MEKDGKLDMLRALDSSASSIHVQNGESDFSRFYHMNVPLQLTLECCNGSKPEDYVNIVTLSPTKAVFYQESLSLKNEPYRKNAPHFHDFFEFVIVLEGSMIQKIEGKEYLYPAGSCCLVNRNLRHMERYQTKSRILYIGLTPDFITELFASAQNLLFPNEKDFCDSDLYQFMTSDLKEPGIRAYLDFTPAYRNHPHAAYSTADSHEAHMHTAHSHEPHMHTANPHADAAHPHTDAAHPHAGALHSMAEAMIRTLLFPAFGASYQISGLLCAFLSYLSLPENYHCTSVRLDDNSDFLLFSHITRLFEESDGRMTRAELEQRLHYSGDYLNRIVNKFTDMCLYDYGMTFCMKKAAQYLTETTESVSAIAAALKFTNRTHFYTLFKKKYGVTPKEYRKLHA